MVRKLAPDSKNPIVSRMCFANLTDNADMTVIVAQLEGIDEIVEVGIQPPRYLLKKEESTIDNQE